LRQPEATSPEAPGIGRVEAAVPGSAAAFAWSPQRPPRFYFRCEAAAAGLRKRFAWKAGAVPRDETLKTIRSHAARGAAAKL